MLEPMPTWSLEPKTVRGYGEQFEDADVFTRAETRKRGEVASENQ